MPKEQNPCSAATTSALHYPRKIRYTSAMKTPAFALLALLVLTACATQRSVRIGTPFDAGKARAMLAPGNNQVGGRVMAAMPNGTLVSCAGQVVSLVPLTDYAREWARQFYELGTGKYGTLNAAYRMDSRESEIKFVGAERFGLMETA